MSDIDGDGAQDLAVVDTSDLGSGNIRIRSFGLPQVNGAMSGVVLADVSGEGILDLVRLNGTGGTTSVIRAGGVPHSVEDARFAGPAGDAIVGDFGSPTGLPDGKADLVWISPNVPSAPLPVGSFETRVMFSSGDGHWTSPATDAIQQALDGMDFIALDVNRDSLDDLVQFRSVGDGYEVRMLRSDGRGQWTFSSASFAHGRNCSAQIADINADGFPDFLCAGMAGANFGVDVLLNEAGVVRELAPVTIPGVLTRSFSASFIVADVNGDGADDLVRVAPLASQRPSNSIQVTRIISTGNGEWTVETQDLTTLAQGEEGATTWRAADINEDGLTDLTMIRPSSGTGVLTLLSLINSGNSFVAHREGFSAEDRSTTRYRFDDVTSDGLPDIWRARIDGSVECLRNEWQPPRVVKQLNGLGTEIGVKYGSSRGSHTIAPLGYNQTARRIRS